MIFVPLNRTKQRRQRPEQGTATMAFTSGRERNGTTRWVIQRKAEVVAAVRSGLISLEVARNRYTPTVEEFLNHAVEAAAPQGLRQSLSRLSGIAGRARAAAGLNPHASA